MHIFLWYNDLRLRKVMIMKKLLLASIMIVFTLLLGSCSNQEELKQEFIQKMDALNNMDNGKLTGDIQAYVFNSYDLPDDYKHRDVDEYATNRFIATLVLDDSNHYYELDSQIDFQHSMVVYTKMADREVEFLTLYGVTTATYIDDLSDNEATDTVLVQNYTSILSYDYIWNDDVKITKMTDDSYQMTMNPDSFNQMTDASLQNLTEFDLNHGSDVEITVSISFMEDGISLIMETNMFSYELTENNVKNMQFKFSEQLIIPQGDITMKTPAECIDYLNTSDSSDNLFPYRVEPADNLSYMFDFMFSSEHNNFGKVYLSEGTYEVLYWLITLDGTPTLYTEDMTELTPIADSTYEIPQDGYYVFELQVVDTDNGTIYFSPVEE